MRKTVEEERMSAKRRSGIVDCKFSREQEVMESKAYSRNELKRLRLLLYCYYPQGKFVSLVSKMLGEFPSKIAYFSVKLKAQSIC